LENKVALISGGARGMGAVEARLFVREGAKVALGDVLEEEGRRTAMDIEGSGDSGGEALFVKLDVTEEKDWTRAVEAVVNRFGRLDILVNNAGIFRIVPLEETSLEEWNLVMEVNLTGVFLGTRAVIPQMKRQGGGSIVNISSTSGLVGSSDTSAYQASKGAVRIFTKATAIEFAAQGIRANSVHPGPIHTDMISGLLEDPDFQRRSLDAVPMKRVGTPEDVAYGVLYLASDEAAYITGAELVIDGGKTAQ
jgi:NAD(P)-dependent dehydrogenase (short-subunit alcohol dehydrogenase family)